MSSNEPAASSGHVERAPPRGVSDKREGSDQNIEYWKRFKVPFADFGPGASGPSRSMGVEAAAKVQ
eukprot:10922891-Alexandrium_andersonii.AAC.1